MITKNHLMNLKSLKLILGAGLLFSGTSTVFGQSSSLNIAQSAVPFLRISPDPRAGAMGDAGIALSPDAYATFWNSAKTTFANSQSQIGFTYTPWLKDVATDVYLATVGGYYKISDNQSFTGGIRYFNLGNIQLYNENSNLQGDYRPREFSLEAGYNQKMTDLLSIGVTLRYINSSLANGQIDGTTYKAGNAVAGDISLAYSNLDENGQGWTGGLTASNLGSKIGYTSDPNSKQFLPANLGLGLAYTKVMDELNKFTFTVNANHLLVPIAPSYPDIDNLTDSTEINNAENKYQNDMAQYYSKGVLSSIGSSFSNGAYSASFGAEYAYNNQFFARAGYYYETQKAGNRKYFTAGVGLKYNAYELNFSYLAPSGQGITRNPLSNTLRFGVVFDLAAIAGAE